MLILRIKTNQNGDPEPIKILEHVDVRLDFSLSRAFCITKTGYVFQYAGMEE